MKTRRLFVGIAATVAVLVSAGCSGKNDKIESSDRSNEARSDEPLSGEDSYTYEAISKEDGFTTADEAVELEGDYQYSWSVTDNGINGRIAPFSIGLNDGDSTNINVVINSMVEGSDSGTVTDLPKGEYHVENESAKGSKWKIELKRVE